MARLRFACTPLAVRWGWGIDYILGLAEVFSDEVAFRNAECLNEVSGEKPVLSNGTRRQGEFRYFSADNIQIRGLRTGHCLHARIALRRGRQAPSLSFCISLIERLYGDIERPICGQ